MANELKLCLAIKVNIALMTINAEINDVIKPIKKTGISPAFKSLKLFSKS